MPADEKMASLIDPQGAPDISKAWKFYNTMTLPRRVLKEGTTADFRKLEPGEVVEGSDIYSVWGTPVGEMGDFGLGIILYFKMLLILVATMILCLLFSIPAITYYRSDEYSMGQKSIADWKLSIGSAICDQYIPVCTDSATCTCETEMFDSSAIADHPVIYLGTVTGDNCAMKTVCPMEWNLAYYDMAMLAFLCVGVYLLGSNQNKTVEEADEAEQTAQDYSIIVNDPDEDATNPDEWWEFFGQFGHVSYVTVAINNGELLHALAERRVLSLKIAYETALPSERASMFDPAENDAQFNLLSNFKKRMITLGLAGDITVLRKNLSAVNEKIDGLLRKNYTAVKVFVVFETESCQRMCLKEMTVGTIPALLETSVSIPEHQRFRHTNVLSINEAPEPSDVIWCNLETSIKHRLVEQSLTMFVTCVLVGIAGGLIYVISAENAGLAGLFVSVANGALPAILKMLNETEEHLTQGSRQSSLLVKLVLARWMTTGFIIWAIRGYENTIKEEFLTKIAAILFADALTTPIMRALDIGGRLGRHYLAKSAQTQEKMNSFFLNTSWFLAERYTDMTKSLFVGLFFASMYPAGLVFSCGAFFICYWVDKYCLFRLWKQPPAIDASLTAASRMQIAVLLIVHSVIASEFYAGFPFDNLAKSSTESSCTVTLTQTIAGVSGSTSTLTGPEYCYDVADTEPYGHFNIEISDTMEESQKTVVQAWSAINITLMCLVSILYFGKTAAFSVYKLFYGEYIAVGEPNVDLFSFVAGMATYVPMYESELLPLPLICCDMSLFDTDHINFTSDYSKLDVTNDSIVLAAREKGVDTSKCFSICKQYPTEELKAANAAAGK